MKILIRLVLVCLLALFSVSCEERTDRTDSGGVLLDVQWQDTPLRVSVNASGDRLIVPTIVITSTIAQPGGQQSSLMDVEMESFEITFSRGDAGTRLPPPYVQDLLGTVPVGGTLTLTDWIVMSFEQFRTAPLSDLRFENGGFDKETGTNIVRLNVNMRVFGRTRSGQAVASVPRSQSVEFAQ